MGQALLPGHLSALEESALEDSTIRFRIHGLPYYGLAALRWNEALLSEGVLSLEAMTLILPSGLLLELKGNAQISPLNLNVAGVTLLPVYLHVRGATENAAWNDNERPTFEREGVTYWMWSLKLSIEQESPDTLESFRLAEFEKRPDGVWALAPNYIPPLLSIGTLPFLKAGLSELSQRLDSYLYQLNQEISAIYLSGEDLGNAKQCLKSIIHLQRFLGNLNAQIHIHPYYLYEALKHFYVDLCFYHNSTPLFATAAYHHDQLSEVFGHVFEPLTEELTLSKSRSPYVPLNAVDGIVQANLPASIRDAEEVYLLVQKKKITESVDISRLKIAAVSRIPVVHKFYLQGIGHKRLDRPPFQHSFGAEVDIFQLNGGEEWDHALKELTVGFYEIPELSDEKFFLYWRSH